MCYKWCDSQSSWLRISCLWQVDWHLSVCQSIHPSTSKLVNRDFTPAKWRQKQRSSSFAESPMKNGNLINRPNRWQGCPNNWRREELTMRTPNLLLLLSVRACWASWRAREGPTFPISSSGLCHTVLQLLVSEAGCCGKVRFGNLSFLCFQLSFSILHNSLVCLKPFQSHGEVAHWATAGS